MGFESKDYHYTSGRGYELDYKTSSPKENYAFCIFKWFIVDGDITIIYDDDMWNPIYIVDYQLRGNSFYGYIYNASDSRVQFDLEKPTFTEWDYYRKHGSRLLAYSFTSPQLHLMLPPSPRAWFFACWLGLVPTVLSLLFMTISVHEVGATPRSIMGALEPLTAVAIGVTVFGESFTARLVAGIVLILVAVLLIVLGRRFHLRAITHMKTLLRKTQCS